MAEPIIIAEGPVAYVTKSKPGYEITVRSSNYVTHLLAGIERDEAKARRVCDRLNAHPDQVRRAYGLL